jgi:hypothetical protein
VASQEGVFINVALVLRVGQKRLSLLHHTLIPTRHGVGAQVEIESKI